ncbi:MurR/RpiR family transcriptional regulator [Treponema primitia]|uniref:MurR/RpiR family transcriptional regulator n=1 Tax=Treponema primitia TaxID=88058 RepID=UPI0039801FD9
MADNILIFDKIEKGLPTLTNSQKKVADYILKNPMQAAFSTIDEIARIVKTSTTTVVRFALTLKFTGYAELQKNLQEYLKIKSGPSVKLEMNFHNFENRNNLITDIVRQQLDNINITYANLSDNSIIQAAKKISSARHIYVFGQRSCHCVSHYLAYNINRILGNCDFIYNGNLDIVEFLHRISKKDVVISISFPRYITQVVNFTALAHKRGAFIISVSDGYLSPFASISDILLSSETLSKNFHNSMTSSMLIADILIGVLTDQNRNKAKTNLKDADKILKGIQSNANL